MPEQIGDERALDERLGSRLFLLFKHSFRCPVSTRAFRQYEAFAAARSDVPTGWLDVVDQRPLSLRAAEKTGVEHQSPQALLVKEGAVVWHASHFDITQASLEAAL